MYQPIVLPFRHRQLADGETLVISNFGDYAYLSAPENFTLDLSRQRRQSVRIDD